VLLLRAVATVFLCAYAGAMLATRATPTVAASAIGAVCGATVALGTLGVWH